MLAIRQSDAHLVRRARRGSPRAIEEDRVRQNGLGLTTLENRYGSFRDKWIFLRARGF